jgi:tetratricopeptide (TPR) repeat protein
MTAATALTKENDPGLEALSLQRLGSVFAQEHDFGGAISAFRRALEIYHSLRDRRGEIEALLALGNVSSVTADLIMAQGYYIDALRMAEGANDLVSTGRAEAGMAESYVRVGNWPEALMWLERAYLSFRNAGLRGEEGPILRRLADIHGQQAEPLKAIDSLLAALEVYTELRDSSGSAAVSKELGTYYHLLGDERKATSYLEQGATHARKVGDRKIEAEALQMLRESYLKLGLPDEAAAVERRIAYLQEFDTTASSDADSSSH